MKQIVFDRFGPPEQVVRCVECTDPSPPAAWEITVRIDAFPINPADLAMLRGQYGILPKPPSTIGMEAVGTVIATGKSVHTLEVGDRVVLLANNNWSTLRKIPATLAVKVPTDLDVHQLSLLKVSGMTAMLLLTNQDLISPGQFVVQNAPLSAVGRFVIQISKHLNLNTISLVRNPEQIDAVKALGSDMVILDDGHSAETLQKQLPSAKVRIALDAVAGIATQRLAECLSEGGTILSYGMLSLQPCQIDATQTIFRNINLVGFWLSKVLNRLSAADRDLRLRQLVDLLRDGRICGAIDSVHSIEHIKDAIQRAEQPGRSGKVIVDVREHS